MTEGQQCPLKNRGTERNMQNARQDRVQGKRSEKRSCTPRSSYSSVGSARCLGLLVELHEEYANLPTFSRTPLSSQNIASPFPPFTLFPASYPPRSSHHSSSKMVSDGKMLCLTIYSYKKDGLSDEEYRDYMLSHHAPLASTLMEKYGIVDFTMVQAFFPHSIILFHFSREPQLTQSQLARHT